MFCFLITNVCHYEIQNKRFNNYFYKNVFYFDIQFYIFVENITMAKKLLSVRVSDEVDGLVKKIAEKRQSTQANIIEEAVRDLAKKEKIKP